MKIWQPLEESSCYSFVFAPLIPVKNFGLDTSDITVTLTFDLCPSKSNQFIHVSQYSVEALLKYLHAKYKHLAAVTLPFDLQNLIRSSLSHSKHLCKVWKENLKAFLRFHVYRHNVNMRLLWPWHLTHDPQNLISSSVSHGAKFEENSWKPSRDIALTRNPDGQTDRQPENIMPLALAIIWRGGIKISFIQTEHLNKPITWPFRYSWHECAGVDRRQQVGYFVTVEKEQKSHKVTQENYFERTKEKLE